jgi:threonine/homoserine/homoserine lactone efflux protein
MSLFTRELERKMETWLRGVILGFSIAAPVGPIGVLCIRRTLADGRLIGFVSGLGAATADGFYGAVAAFGLSAVSDLLAAQRLWLHLLGGVFLCYLGVRTITRKPSPLGGSAAIPLSASPQRGAISDIAILRPRRHLRLAGAYLSTLGLTLTNPATIFSFAVIFAGLGVVGARASTGHPYPTATALVVGVFCGSALWWLLLSSGVGSLRARLGPRALRAVNVLSGIILLGFGIAVLVSAR